MSGPPDLKPLKQVKTALADIKTQLKPFLQLLKKKESDLQQRAQAHAVVSLSLGTLRYMAVRLAGKDEGRKEDDPLRQELNQMRKVLVEIEKKGKQLATNKAKAGSRVQTGSKAASGKKTPQTTKPRSSRPRLQVARNDRQLSRPRSRVRNEESMRER